MKYIYLHGFLCGPSSTKGEFLSKKFSQVGKELLRPDLNTGDFENMTISSQLGVVENLIGLWPEKVALIGSSLGALIAVLTADKISLVKKLVLMAPALDFADRYFQSLAPDELQRWKENGSITMYHYQFKKDMPLGYGIAVDAENYKDLEVNKTPETLIFHGIQDKSVPYQVSLNYLQNNPNSRLMLFNSDHGLIDQLGTMWKYIEDFLELSECNIN